MASTVPMKVDVRRVTSNRDLFEFSVETPVTRMQFRLPRHVVNQLRVVMEKALLRNGSK